MSQNRLLLSHSQKSVNLLFMTFTSFWIPAFAGMTTILEFIIFLFFCIFLLLPYLIFTKQIALRFLALLEITNFLSQNSYDCVINFAS